MLGRAEVHYGSDIISFRSVQIHSFIQMRLDSLISSFVKCWHRVFNCRKMHLLYCSQVQSVPWHVPYIMCIMPYSILLQINTIAIIPIASHHRVHILKLYCTPRPRHHIFVCFPPLQIMPRLLIFSWGFLILHVQTARRRTRILWRKCDNTTRLLRARYVWW